MNKKIALIALLMCFSGASLAAATLQIGNNVSVLAAKSAEVSAFSREIKLADGAQKIIIKFDSPADPGSANQSLGRIVSAPLLLNFTVSEGDVVQLATPMLMDERAAQAFAKKPRFTLTNQHHQPVAFTQHTVDNAANTIFTNYDAVLNDATSETFPATSSDIPEVKGADLPQLNAAQADAVMKKLYLNADEKRRKAFIRWALDL